MLATLADMLKAGEISRLEAVNVEVHPERAAALGVRSVPWLKLGAFELPGVRSREELQAWLRRVDEPDGLAEYFHLLLKEGRLDTVLKTVQQRPDTLAAALPIVGNPEASINVRIGAGVLFEAFAGQPALQALVPHLAELAGEDDARVRADACHYLSLTRSPAAIPVLRQHLHDADESVREIAQDSLVAIETARVD
jgi:HEAT repeat protein